MSLADEFGIDLKKNEVQSDFIEYDLDTGKPKILVTASVDYMLGLYHTMVDPVKKIMYIYNEEKGTYQLDYGSAIENQFIGLFGDLLTPSLISTLKFHIFRTPKYQVETSPEMWMHSDILNFKNGVYNIKEQKLYPHSHEYKFISQIGTKYDPDARCPNIDRAMKNIFTDDQILKEFEWLGFCLTSGYAYKLISIYCGATNCGKSTYFNIVSKMMGEDNLSQLEPQDISKEFYLINLYGKMLNIAGDVGAHTISGFNKIKELTGLDKIIANVKGQPMVSFRNQAKLMWGCNRLPNFDDTNEATYGRIRQIDCEKVINPKDIDSFDMNDYTSEEELSGLLNHALEGLKRLTERGHFELPTIEERISKHENSANSFFNWADENLTFTSLNEDRIHGDELYNNYRLWCKENGVINVQSSGSFLRDFKKNMHKKYIKYTAFKMNGEKKRGVIGCKFFDAEESPEEGVRNWMDK